MHPDLVHAPGERLAEYDRASSVEAHPLELRVAVLALRTDLAHADLVAHHLDRLLADYPLAVMEKSYMKD